MKFISRLKNIFKAKAHATLDTIEDPMELANQAKRDLQDKIHEVTLAAATIKTELRNIKQQSANTKIDISAVTKQIKDLNDPEDRSSQTLARRLILLENQARRLADIEEAIDKRNKTTENYVLELREQYQTIDVEISDLKSRSELNKVVNRLNEQLGKDLQLSTSTDSGVDIQNIRDIIQRKENETEGYSEILEFVQENSTTSVTNRSTVDDSEIQDKLKQVLATK